MKTFALSSLAAFSLLATAVQAQELQTFTYDVHGRLVAVTRTAGAASQTTSYVLDNADNRTSRVTTATSARPASGSSAGSALQADEAPGVALATEPAAQPASSVPTSSK